LSADGIGNIGYFDDFIGDMSRTVLCAQGGPDLILYFIIESFVWSHHYKQRHPKLSSRFFNAHHQAVLDLLYGVDGPVHFTGSDAYTAAIEGGVRSSIDDDSTVGSDFDPVTMSPYTGILFKIAFGVPGKIRVIPEVDRHGGHWSGNHHLANLIFH